MSAFQTTYNNLYRAIIQNYTRNPFALSDIIIKKIKFGECFNLSTDEKLEDEFKKCLEERTNLLLQETITPNMLNEDNAGKNFILFLLRDTKAGRQFKMSKKSSSSSSSSRSDKEEEEEEAAKELLDKKLAKGCKNPVSPDKINITFQDIAGQYETKHVILNTYIYPGRYPNLFVTKTKGMLFYGPPGSGKTLLAKATVGELKGATAFYDPTPGEIKGAKHGRTEKNIDLLFNCAADIIGKPSPYADEYGNQLNYESSIIFIDEFEGIGGLKRGDPMMTLSVNALLQKMDGMSSSPGVSVIAATNFPWNLEEAILRRFTNRVLIDLPDKKAREFLILEPLYKYFYFPPMDEKEKKRKHPLLLKSGKLDYSFLDKLDEYGNKICRRKFDQSKYNFDGREPDSEIISEKFIKYFSKKLGPNEKGKDIIKQIKNGEIGKDYDPSKEELGDVEVGYSGSDISKIMDIAIQKAASRALEKGIFKKVIIKSDKGDEYYYVTAKFDGNSPDEFYTIYKEKMSYSTYKDKGIKLIDNTSEERKRIINLSICAQDIEFAMKEYPSTINTVNYLDLLIYRYQNRPPSSKR